MITGMKRMLAGCFSAAALTACGTAPQSPQVVEKPVCDPACQKALRLDNITKTLSLVRDPKTGGVNPTVAAMILRIHGTEDEAGKKIINNGLKGQGLTVDTKSACLITEKENGEMDFLCPKL